MKHRGTFHYPYLSGTAVQTIVEVGPLGTAVRVHVRPEYTDREARTVCRWVDNQDEPLPLAERTRDAWDPRMRQGMRQGYRNNVMGAPRLGLEPLP